MLKKVFFLTLMLVCLHSLSTAQIHNVRAHYAHGQVWVFWNAGTLASTAGIYSIYRAPAPFTSTTDPSVEQVGQLFAEEVEPFALKDQFPPAQNFTIPYPTASTGTYTLLPTERLFVETVTPATGGNDYYYAIIKGASTTVSPSQIAAAPVTHLYDLADPPICHLQYKYISAADNFTSEAFYLWADGRNGAGGRPDFPVMANKVKNGMPSLFIVSYEGTLRKASYTSMVHWLHGGGGEAIQSLPNKRTAVDLRVLPDQLLVAQNDDFVRKVYDHLGREVLITQKSNSWFFGWAENHDPFDPAYSPGVGDEIINYTQRRLNWINDWIVGEFSADANRVSIQGHSMGSAGALAWAKAYPNRFATVSLFNCGFDRQVSPAITGDNLFGDHSLNLPTCLTKAGGAVVPIGEVFTLNDPISPERDLPIINSWHGKRDNNGTMQWDTLVVMEYELADELGWGVRSYWDERGHGFGEHCGYWKDIPMGPTERDNVAYQARYRSDESFPACYHHQPIYEPLNHSPGDGTKGIKGTPGFPCKKPNAKHSGDDHGTWGGYHDWEIVEDVFCRWSANIWLISGSSYAVDNSLHASLLTSVAIRKPQHFTPVPGRTVYWELADLASGTSIANGSTVVDPEGVVRITGILVQTSTSQLTVSCVPPLRLGEMTVDDMPQMIVSPNPSARFFQVHATGTSAIQALEVLDMQGRSCQTTILEESQGYKLDLGGLVGGIYLLKVKTQKGVVARKLILR